MLNAMRNAVVSSALLQIVMNSPQSNSSHSRMNHKEAFWLATMGGAQVLDLEDTIGNFVVGKSFDALLISYKGNDGRDLLDLFDDDGIEEIFEKFIFLGDDRFIERVFVHGRRVI